MSVKARRVITQSSYFLVAKTKLKLQKVNQTFINLFELRPHIDGSRASCYNG